MKTTTAQASETTMTRFVIRARAFNNKLETIQVMVEGSKVSVYDDVAQHFTTCHTMSPRDINRCLKAAKNQS
jgi:hypothetical protein